MLKSKYCYVRVPCKRGVMHLIVFYVCRSFNVPYPGYVLTWLLCTICISHFCHAFCHSRLPIFLEDGHLRIGKWNKRVWHRDVRIVTLVLRIYLTTIGCCVSQRNQLTKFLFFNSIEIESLKGKVFFAYLEDWREILTTACVYSITTLTFFWNAKK